MSELIPVETIAQKIFLLRGQKVMLDKDLAELYGVETKNLNKAVARNLDRFPEDFMYRLTTEEFESLRFHFGTSKKGRGGRRYLPYVFTEQGVAMLSSVLKSKRAVQINILIMRAFVQLREFLATHKSLASKLDEIEKKLQTHDVQIRGIIEAIRQMMLPPEKPKRPIGFHVEEPVAKYTAKRKR